MSAKKKTENVAQYDTYDIFDFDHTIYDGDSTLDFYFFCLRRHPVLIKHFPFQLWSYVRFTVGGMTRTHFKAAFFVFLKGIEDVDSITIQFWDLKESNIKKWYASRDHKKDIIISASPEFLLSPIVDQLQAHGLIATKMDKKTGNIVGENCYGKEKSRRLADEFGDVVVNNAYTDSLSDAPLLELAKNPYIVQKETVSTLADYEKQSALKRFFLSVHLLLGRGKK